jgi:hypothetical protein
MDSACVQYNDMKGTVALDRSDTLPMDHYAKNKGLLEEDDSIQEFRAYYHYLPKTFSVTAKTRMKKELEFDLSLGEFFDLFKRLEMVCGKGGFF